MKLELKGWLFKLKVSKETDAHRTLVSWLRERNLSHLFSEDQKLIGYVVQHDGDECYLIARSSIEIIDPIVQESSKTINPHENQIVAITVPASKLIRPPCLKYEEAKKKRVRNKIVNKTQAELNHLAQALAIECGMSDVQVLNITPTKDIVVHHKRQNIFFNESAALIILNGKITDQEKLIQAWSSGVGAKRVYGFGLVRIL